MISRRPFLSVQAKCNTPVHFAWIDLIAKVDIIVCIIRQALRRLSRVFKHSFRLQATIWDANIIVYLCGTDPYDLNFLLLGMEPTGLNRHKWNLKKDKSQLENGFGVRKFRWYPWDKWASVEDLVEDTIEISTFTSLSNLKGGMRCHQVLKVAFLYMYFFFFCVYLFEQWTIAENERRSRMKSFFRQ